MTFFYFCLGSLLCLSLAAGQVCFKLAADQSDEAGNPLALYKVAISVPMVSACILYATSIVIYVFLLRRIPLSQAYLFSIAGAAIVPFIAASVFKEPLSINYIIGAVLVITGVSISTLS